MSETTMLLRLAASLPCDPRHRATLSKAADEIEQLQATNQQFVEALDRLVTHSKVAAERMQTNQIPYGDVLARVVNQVEAMTNAKQQEVG